MYISAQMLHFEYFKNTYFSGISKPFSEKSNFRTKSFPQQKHRTFGDSLATQNLLIN